MDLSLGERIDFRYYPVSPLTGVRFSSTPQGDTATFYVAEGEKGDVGDKEVAEVRQNGTPLKALHPTPP